MLSALQAECTGTFIDSAGDLVPREWTNLSFNFDNVGNAFLTLFITATLDGYTPAMYMSMSARWGLESVWGGAGWRR